MVTLACRNLEEDGHHAGLIESSKMRYETVTDEAARWT